eukprot:57780-Rhodomonas_salina.1
MDRGSSVTDSTFSPLPSLPFSSSLPTSLHPLSRLSRAFSEQGARILLGGPPGPDERYHLQRTHLPTAPGPHQPMRCLAYDACCKLNKAVGREDRVARADKNLKVRDQAAVSVALVARVVVRFARMQRSSAAEGREMGCEGGHVKGVEELRLKGTLLWVQDWIIFYSNQTSAADPAKDNTGGRRYTEVRDSLPFSVPPFWPPSFLAPSLSLCPFAPALLPSLRAAVLVCVLLSTHRVSARAGNGVPHAGLPLRPRGCLGTADHHAGPLTLSGGRGG